MEDKEICAHLNPQEINSSEFHNCAAKRLLSNKRTGCVASNVGQYSESFAQRCPLFTTDKNYAEVVQIALKELTE